MLHLRALSRLPYVFLLCLRVACRPDVLCRTASWLLFSLFAPVVPLVVCTLSRRQSQCSSFRTPHLLVRYCVFALCVMAIFLLRLSLTVVRFPVSPRLLCFADSLVPFIWSTCVRGGHLSLVGCCIHAVHQHCHSVASSAKLSATAIQHCRVCVCADVL